MFFPTALALAALTTAPFADGDRVVWFGDSITAQHTYTRWVEEFVKLRHPELSVVFVNAGIGGQSALDGLARFDNDLLVGMRGFYGSRWEGGVPARQLPVLVADDLLVGEHHRDRGLVTQLMQAAFEDLRGSGARFVLNLSGGPLTVLNSLAMGWRSIGSARPMNRRAVRFGPTRLRRRAGS